MGRYVAAWTVLLLLFFITPVQKQAGASETSAGIIIPLYSEPPGTDWNDVILERTEHPSVPMIVVINPDNGPDPFDPNYVPVVQQLQSLGVKVLGYVYTSYGTRNYTEMTSEISDYKNLYDVNGIFLDEMASDPGYEAVYGNLTDYSRSIGLGYTVGNAGTDPSPSYVGTVNNIIIYENSSLPEISSLGGWHMGYNKGNFSVLGYGTGSLNMSYVQEISNYVGYIYFTNYTLPNPWGNISPLLGNMTSFLPLSVNVGLEAVDTTGRVIDGPGATIKLGSQDLLYGTLPANFSLNALGQYTAVVPQNFGGYTFYRWQDSGSTLNQRTFSPGSNTTLVAQYQTTTCEPPAQGDWNITQTCTLASSLSAPQNVIVQDNSVLTIPSGTRLGIDFTHYHLLIRAGSGVLIRAGGSIN